MKLSYWLPLLLLISCKHEPKERVDRPFQLKIAYNVLYDDESDNYEVFSMNLDGSQRANISNLEGVEWTYYANGDNVYFVSDKDTTFRNYQLFKMKSDGSQKIKISNIRLKDSWHSSRKDGTEFIINPHQSVDSTFYIIDADGKVLNKIRPALKYFSDPAFSPEGNRIAFRGAHYGSKRDSSFIDEIYVMNDDGSGLKQLTHYPEKDTTAAWYAYKAGPPKWHPTENFISYASFQDGKYSLYGVTLDGKFMGKLTENKQGEVYHDWSPDGKWLVTDLSNDDESQYYIGLMNWATKETKILTDTIYKYQQGPVFVKANE